MPLSTSRPWTLFQPRGHMSTVSTITVDTSWTQNHINHLKILSLMFFRAWTLRGHFVDTSWTLKKRCLGFSRVFRRSMLYPYGSLRELLRRSGPRGYPAVRLSRRRLTRWDDSPRIPPGGSPFRGMCLSARQNETPPSRLQHPLQGLKFGSGASATLPPRG